MTIAFGLSDLFTLARASNAWFFNEQGLLESVGNDVARFAYDPVGLAPLGWLIERSSVNSCLDSQDLTTGNWALVSTPTRAQDAIGLDGTANAATTLTDADGASQEGVSQGITIADDSNTHTASIFILKDSITFRFPHLKLQYTGGTGIAESIVLNTSTGSFVEDHADGSVIVEDFGLWWKIILTLANNNTGNVTATIRILAAFNSDETTTPAVAATGSIIVGHAQFEEDQEWASSPIVTTGSAVTRNSDVLKTTDIDWFNKGEGTLYIEMTPGKSTIGLTSGRIDAFAVDDNSSTNTVRFLSSTTDFKMAAQVRQAGTSLFTITHSQVLTVNTAFKMAFGYKSGDSIMALDGILSTQDTTIFDITGESYTTALLGQSDAGGFQLDGYIKTVKYYPKRLTDAELVALTT